MKHTLWFLFFLLPSWAMALPDWPREVNTQLCGQARSELLERLVAGVQENMQVAYFDTANLELLARSLNVRLRIKDDEAEVTVKWRAESLPETGLSADCEVDVYRGRILSACSWNQEVDRTRAQAVMRGQGSVYDLLNADQKVLLQRLTSGVSGEWRRHGPVNVERFKIKAAQLGKGQVLGKKWRLERWLLPNQELIVSEVSFTENEALGPAELSDLLSRHLRKVGVTPCEHDEPKTSRVLRYFQQQP